MAQPNYAMDRRQELRTSSKETVTVTNLTAAWMHFTGQLRDLSSHGLGLILSLPLETDTTISVEWEDTIVLGQIAYCHKCSGKYHAGLRTEYLIYDRSQSKRSQRD
ncbi:MAG TPA: PilZ domain-containing protein [Acidobacteriota bacterium]|nr:PilZ domain-containing protein [Acidobacteriota bacterium]